MMLLIPVIFALMMWRKVWGDTSCYVCGDDMYRFGDSCYQFNTDKTDLSTGKANCETIGFHLVYIGSSEEQDFLASTGDSVSPRREYWIGIEKNAAGEQVWMDGSAITYSNFGSMDEGGECFRLKHQNDYSWADQECDHDKYGHICEREQLCEENMFTFGDSCYLFKTDETDIATAKTNCEAKGFHLVYIETSEEQDFLASKVDTVTPEQDYWIGIEINADGDKIWMDGSAITYSNFGKVKKHECFRMKKKDYSWEDHQCDHDHDGSICEREGGCSANVTTQRPTTFHDPTTITVTSPSTEPSTTTQVASTTKIASTIETKLPTTVNTQETLQPASTMPYTTSTEPPATSVFGLEQKIGNTSPLPSSMASQTLEEVPSTTKFAITTQMSQTPDKVPGTTKVAITSEMSQTPDKVPSTTNVAMTTEMESSTTMTTQETLSTTSRPATFSATTTQLSSTRSAPKKIEIASSTPHSTTSFVPSETAATPATKQRLLSSKFRLLATNSMLVDAFVSVTTTARSVIRCASSCIHAETCSHFSYAPFSSRCILGYTTIDDSDSFVNERGSNTYTVH